MVGYQSINQMRPPTPLVTPPTPFAIIGDKGALAQSQQDDIRHTS
jgi:hypothetical protein